MDTRKIYTDNLALFRAPTCSQRKGIMLPGSGVCRILSEYTASGLCVFIAIVKPPKMLFSPLCATDLPSPACYSLKLKAHGQYTFYITSACIK